MVKEKLVVIGNGMAGCRAVEEILARDAGRYRITIIGAEPRVNYNRIMLSPVLAGEKAFADIVINDEAWYADNGITLHAGRAVTGVDAGDFSLAGTGISGASISSVGGSKTSYTVAASSGRDGTLGLSLSNDGSIENAAGNSMLQRNIALAATG